MKKLLRIATLAAAAALHVPSSTAAVGVPVTYTKLVWSFSSTATAFAGCTQIVMDATGDIVLSDNLVLSGALNCGVNAYVLYGAAYFGATGTLNMSFSHGSYITTCGRMVNLVGTCTTLDAAGVQRGISTIRLQ